MDAEEIKRISNAIREETPSLFWSILANHPAAELDNEIEKFVDDRTALNFRPMEDSERKAALNDLTDRFTKTLQAMAGFTTQNT